MTSKKVQKYITFPTARLKNNYCKFTIANCGYTTLFFIYLLKAFFVFKSFLIFNPSKLRIAAIKRLRILSYKMFLNRKVGERSHLSHFTMDHS